MTDDVVWRPIPSDPQFEYRRDGATVYWRARGSSSLKRVSGSAFIAAYDTRRPDPDIHRRVCLYCGRDDCHHIREGNRPVINVSAEAANESKRMTLAELAAFVDQARAAGVPDGAELAVITKGISGRLSKIATAEPK